MKKTCAHINKAMLAKLLVIIMLILYIVVIPSNITKASSNNDTKATSLQQENVTLLAGKPPRPTTAPTPTPTSTPTPTPTVIPTPVPEFNDLNQSEILAAMDAGWNLGNQLEATDSTGYPGETIWGNPVITEEMILAAKAAGFKTIRIPVSYLKYIGPAPSYTIDANWLNRVQQVVDYCVNNDMFAIINMHGDGYSTIPGGWLLPASKNQRAIKEKYQAVWSQIATKFKDYDEHLIFESMNEVFDGTYSDPPAASYANLNAYNQIFVDTVRQSGGNNSMRWVLVPGWNTNIDYTAGNYGFVIPTDSYLSNQIPAGEKRIMISVHYYSPWDFCGTETGDYTQWGESATDPSKVSSYAGQSFMASQFKLLYDAFTSKGYPVVVGEYGAIDKSQYDSTNTYYRSYFARKICENSVKYGCIPVIWDNGYNGNFGFGLFDRNSKSVTQPQIIQAIMEVYYGSSSPGTSTGISLNQSNMTMSIGDDPVTLIASLTPDGSTDQIIWTSSDETIATVNDSGIVRAYAIGTAIISATANGHTAQCVVNVTLSQNVRVGLYVIETSTWSTISSSTNADITSQGGTYTLTLTDSQTKLSNIGALYIKDFNVQSGIATTSICTSAMVKIDSVKFNGVSCTVTQTVPQQAVNNGVFDFTILNQWATGSEKISEVTKNAAGSYQFTAAPYQTTNTIEVTFTVTDVLIP